MDHFVKVLPLVMLLPILKDVPVVPFSDEDPSSTGRGPLPYGVCCPESPSCCSFAVCPDGSQCPDNIICCFALPTEYRFCVMENAMCCLDQIQCCASDTHCSEDSSFCLPLAPEVAENNKDEMKVVGFHSAIPYTSSVFQSTQHMVSTTKVNFTSDSDGGGDATRREQ